ncbi:MAG TPA: hypothetical protein PLU16_01735 [Gallionellaceae bacterium]|nr:hypothetical protein [Gallionellaceae bacterium]HQS73900.1 hypothetical protein [Gallionellaceae bacterium]
MSLPTTFLAALKSLKLSLAQIAFTDIMSHFKDQTGRWQMN